MGWHRCSRACCEAIGELNDETPGVELRLLVRPSRTERPACPRNDHVGTHHATVSSSWGAASEHGTALVTAAASSGFPRSRFALGRSDHDRSRTTGIDQPSHALGGDTPTEQHRTANRIARQQAIKPDRGATTMWAQRSSRRSCAHSNGGTERETCDGLRLGKLAAEGVLDPHRATGSGSLGNVRWTLRQRSTGTKIVSDAIHSHPMELSYLRDICSQNRHNRCRRFTLSHYLSTTVAFFDRH